MTEMRETKTDDQMPVITIPADCYERMRIRAEGAENWAQIMLAEVGNRRYLRRWRRRRIQEHYQRIVQSRDQWMRDRSRYEINWNDPADVTMWRANGER